MKRLMILSIIFMSLFLAGCTFGPRPVLETEKPSTDSLSKEIAKESEELDKNQKELRDSLEKAAPRKVEVEPVMPAYDPLE
ncbi:MAG: hypothetical protein DRG73_10395, partial [Deltaproteobacteria bacterium]